MGTTKRLRYCKSSQIPVINGDAMGLTWVLTTQWHSQKTDSVRSEATEGGNDSSVLRSTSKQDKGQCVRLSVKQVHECHSVQTNFNYLFSSDFIFNRTFKTMYSPLLYRTSTVIFSH